MRELLTRLVLAGYHVDLFTCNTESNPPREVVDGIEVWRVSSWNLFQGTYPIPLPSPSTLQVLWQLIRQKPSIIYTYGRFYPSTLIGLFVSKIRNIPMIHSEFGSCHSLTSLWIVNIFCKLYDHTLGSLVVRNAKKLTGNCNATAKFLNHLGGKNVVVICPPSGIDLSTFCKVKTDLTDRLGLNKSNMVVTIVSRLIYAKGVHDLISAFKIIKSKIPCAVLLVVGDGPYKIELERLAAGMKNGQIYFLGQKSPSDVAEILSITDILVNPSYSEGLIAAPVIEAGALGIPSVTTDAGGTKEIVIDGVDAMIVKPGDVNAIATKVCELLNDYDLRMKIGQRIQRLVYERFNWDDIIKLYLREIAAIA